METLEARRRFQEAQDAFAAGQFKQSLDMLLSLATTFRELGIAEGLADTLYQTGQVQIKLGHFQDAALQFKEALELYRFFKKDHRVAMTLHALGSILAESGEEEISRRYYDEALLFYRAIDDDDGIASVVLEMGNLDMKKNELLEARRKYQEAKGLFEKVAHPVGVGKATYMLGVLATIEGDDRGGKASMQEAGRIFYEEDYLEGAIKVKAFEGLMALHQHRITIAEQHFSECLKLIAERDIREPHQRGMLEKEEDVHVLLYMGELLLRDVKYNIPDLGMALNLRAYHFFEQAASLARNVAYKEGECKALHAMGLIQLERGGDELEGAVDKLTAALELAKITSDGEMLTRTMFHLGMCTSMLGDYQAALNNFQDCTLFSRKFHFARMETRALMEQFKILFSLGRLEDAIGILGQAGEIASSQPELQDLESEIAILSSQAALETGEVDRARAILEDFRQVHETRGDVKGVVRMLQGLAAIEESQGLYAIALGYLDEIDALLPGEHGIDTSTRRIDRCRLRVLAGDVDGAFSMLATEITKLQESGLPDVDVLLARANLVLYNILKAKQEPVDADHVLRAVIKHHEDRGELHALVDHLLGIARAALRAVDGAAVKEAVNAAWQAVTRSSIDPPLVAAMLHVLGLVHVQSGALDLARRYLDEALSYMQKHGMRAESGVVIAQLAELSIIENKPDARSLFKEALALLSPVSHTAAVMSVRASLGLMLAREGDVDAALDHALAALRMFENEHILHDGAEPLPDAAGPAFIPVRPINIHALVVGLYMAKFVQENDPVSLERAFIVNQFEKIYHDVRHHLDAGSWQPPACSGLDEKVEADTRLVATARVIQRRLAFLLQKLQRLAETITRKGKASGFTKTALDALDAKIKKDLALLDSALEDVKRNRASLMRCEDPGTFVPFLGFNMARHLQATLVQHPDIIVLDYVIVPSSAKLVIFILYKDVMELVLKDIGDAFFSHLDALRVAREEDDHASILFEHRALTEYLFPRHLKERLEELGMTHPVACPDRLLADVGFNLLGEENDISLSFSIFVLPDLLLLKRVLDAKLGPVSPGQAIIKDIAMFFPDADDLDVDGELRDITLYLERVDAGTVTMLAGKEATYERFTSMENVQPAILHVSAPAFLPSSKPARGFISMHDRPVFTGDLPSLAMGRPNGLACISASGTDPLSMDQLFAAWRVLASCNVPNVIIARSSNGFSGRFFSLLYDRLRKGDTLAMAYRNCMLYFKNVPEISPLARSHHILIGNPNWTMTGGA